MIVRRINPSKILFIFYNPLLIIYTPLIKKRGSPTLLIFYDFVILKKQVLSLEQALAFLYDFFEKYEITKAIISNGIRIGANALTRLNIRDITNIIITIPTMIPKAPFN